MKKQPHIEKKLFFESSLIYIFLFNTLVIGAASLAAYIFSINIEDILAGEKEDLTFSSFFLVVNTFVLINSCFPSEKTDGTNLSFLILNGVISLLYILLAELDETRYPIFLIYTLLSLGSLFLYLKEVHYKRPFFKLFIPLLLSHLGLIFCTMFFLK